MLNMVHTTYAKHSVVLILACHLAFRSAPATPCFCTRRSRALTKGARTPGEDKGYLMLHSMLKLMFWMAAAFFHLRRRCRARYRFPAPPQRRPYHGGRGGHRLDAVHALSGAALHGIRLRLVAIWLRDDGLGGFRVGAAPWQAQRDAHAAWQHVGAAAQVYGQAAQRRIVVRVERPEKPVAKRRRRAIARK